MTAGCWQLLTKQKPYSLYLLAILLVTYLLSQINQYVMAVVARPMAQVSPDADAGSGPARSWWKELAVAAHRLGISRQLHHS